MLEYILFNSIVYGVVGAVMISFFAYYKITHLTTGTLLVCLAYGLYFIVSQENILGGILLLLAILILYMGVSDMVLRFFRDPAQRDLFGVIFTFSLAFFLEAFLGFLFGAVPINLPGNVSVAVLIPLFIVLNIVLIYFLRSTLVGKVFHAIYENPSSIAAMGTRIKLHLFFLSLVLFIFLLLLAYFILLEGAIRPTDGVFFVLKGLGIMVLVGGANLHYVFLGAFGYVVVEYLLFVSIGLPIAYKETLILVVILLVLIFKPEGLFSLKTRKT